MRTERVSLFLGLALALGSASCGTIVNLVRFDAEDSGHRYVYGGVRVDLHGIRDANKIPSDASETKSDIGIVVMLFALLDLPLSAVGDTLTLPITLFSSHGEPAEPQPEQATAE